MISPNFMQLFSMVKVMDVFISAKMGFGHILDDIFTDFSGHPAGNQKRPLLKKLSGATLRKSICHAGTVGKPSFRT
jgi:hypothetical protein